ncbi:MAG: GNAT family N-acetyltransferase [Nocardioides sp.]
MLWRIRTTLPDRPGALAALAAGCGDAGVNILGLQVFPGVESVTDELVLQTPDGWGSTEICELLGRSGALSVSAAPCTEAALMDQPTRYVQAARRILARPASFPEVVARLFDAAPEQAEQAEPVVPEQDVMDMVVGDIQVQVRRSAPFTATEHARGASLADLVSDVLRCSDQAPTAPPPIPRLGGDVTPQYVVTRSAVTAEVDGVVVGRAVVAPADEEPEARSVALEVDPAFQRRGIGTRLLVDAARIVNGLGVAEMVLSTRSDNQAVLPMVMAAGLRGRIRMAGDTLTVRVPVRDLKPLRL